MGGANLRPTGGKRVYTRIILVKCKDDATQQGKQAFLDAAYGLKGIPGVQTVSAGTNVGPRPEGYHLGAVVHFDDKAAKDAYEPHELHKALVATLGPIRESVMLFDVEA